MMEEIIRAAIASINEDLESKALTNLDKQSALFEHLDSVSLLNLILELEDRLQQKYGYYVQIADEDVMNTVNTPFKNVYSLSKFLQEKVRGENKKLGKN